MFTDYNVFFFQYPLPEVVVIHQDNKYLEDVKSLETYITEVSFLLKEINDKDFFTSVGILEAPTETGYQKCNSKGFGENLTHNTVTLVWSN